MADFVAVLRKAIGSLGENTPAMREKVFDKARTTIEAKLKAINPPPPAAVVERQLKALEDAIATVQADYALPAVATMEDDAGDMLESVFATLDQPIAPPAPPARDPYAQATGKAIVPPPVLPAPEPAQAAPALPPMQPNMPAAGPRPDSEGLAGGRLSGEPAPPRRAAPSPASRRRSRTGLTAALAIIALLAVAGSSYIWWSGSPDTPASVTQAPENTVPAPEEAAATVDDLPDAEQETAPQVAETDAPATTPTTTTDNAASPEKLTQRLLPDGSEVDEGPAGGGSGIGEGSSVASAERAEAPEAAAPADQAQPEAADDSPQTAVVTPQEQDKPTQPAAITVGQRAIFYEERTATSEGSAETGSIAWSLVQESPGGDLPPEPAIRAEATIPGKDVQLRMTIRRNGDQTLPASHIVEMIFLMPDGFEGGGVSSVSRIAFKETEQAAGSPLIGIPAKIADGFFLIALSDAPAETQANLNLMQRESWVDIPIIYQSGQRALLSLEKGIPGDRVFQEALRAWSDAENG